MMDMAIGVVVPTWRGWDPGAGAAIFRVLWELAGLGDAAFCEADFLDGVSLGCRQRWPFWRKREDASFPGE
jgi:hypothetical protein